jgi:hypothetical protein
MTRGSFGAGGIRSKTRDQARQVFSFQRPKLRTCLNSSTTSMNLLVFKGFSRVDKDGEGQTLHINFNCLSVPKPDGEASAQKADFRLGFWGRGFVLARPAPGFWV